MNLANIKSDKIYNKIAFKIFEKLTVYIFTGLLLEHTKKSGLAD